MFVFIIQFDVKANINDLRFICLLSLDNDFEVVITRQ